MDDLKRWDSEREFFDNEVYETSTLPASVVNRYAECRKPWLPAEFCFSELGDLRGKRILDVGCGDGRCSLLLALKGATVVGVDISPRAIEAASQRAAAQGLSDRITFLASPFELFAPPQGEKFDVVCGWAVLHHLIPVLDSMIGRMVGWVKPGGTLMFVEPIAPWHWLRSLRLSLPISTNGTPDERPLEPAEIAVLARHMPNLRIQYHDALLRIVNRFFLEGRYEDISPLWRGFYDIVARTDNMALNKAGLHGFASSATLYGTVG